MELAASTISGTASFDSTDNAITDSGTLAITGATTIDAGTADITLDETASTFGALALTGARCGGDGECGDGISGIHDQRYSKF